MHVFVCMCGCVGVTVLCVRMHVHVCVCVHACVRVCVCVHVPMYLLQKSFSTSAGVRRLWKWTWVATNTQHQCMWEYNEHQTLHQHTLNTASSDGLWAVQILDYRCKTTVHDCLQYNSRQKFEGSNSGKWAFIKSNAQRYFNTISFNAIKYCMRHPLNYHYSRFWMFDLSRVHVSYCTYRTHALTLHTYLDLRLIPSTKSLHTGMWQTGKRWHHTTPHHTTGTILNNILYVRVCLCSIHSYTTMLLTYWVESQK